MIEKIKKASIDEVESQIREIQVDYSYNTLL